MALQSGELERRDQVLLSVHVTEQDDEAMLTLANYGGKGPIAFLSHQREPAMKKFIENGAERVLASMTKQLLQLQAIAKEQPIIIFSMAGELARIKKNLVVNQARVNSQKWSQWGMVLCDNQFDWRMIKLKREEKMTKYHDKHQNLPKYFTDGSERAGKVKWGYLVRHERKLITSQSGEITGTAQLAEVMAVEKALQKAIELGHKEIVLTSDSEYLVDGVQKELETWRVNGFHTARGKPMAHKEQWEKIDKLLQEVNAHFYHQVSHTKQTGEAADGNRESSRST
uniref:ribonuclease H n=1 Tax=Cyprinus carpio TaxID=7962 RepID=A0A8C1CAL9_CYPCA